jgi:Icc-related predicted phosphoesterase
MDQIGKSRVVNPGPAAMGHYALVEIDSTVSVRLDG